MPKRKTCPIYIGTSGWYYRDWIGPFYPKKLKSYEDLSFYSKSFRTVENNSAFYHMLQKSTIKKWIKATQPDFIFSVKLNQSITHFRALIVKAETKELLKVYFEAVGELQDQLGVILIQLPGRFRLNLERLEQFLKYYTKVYAVRTAIEFRNPSWFCKDIYALLKEYNVALAVAQSSRYPLDHTITADFGYFRFHGPEKLFASSYSQEQLEYWAGIIKRNSKTLKAIYVYFNNDWNVNAVKNARNLKDLLGTSAR